MPSTWFGLRHDLYIALPAPTLRTTHPLDQFVDSNMPGGEVGKRSWLTFPDVTAETRQDRRILTEFIVQSSDLRSRGIRRFCATPTRAVHPVRARADHCMNLGDQGTVAIEFFAITGE